MRGPAPPAPRPARAQTHVIPLKNPDTALPPRSPTPPSTPPHDGHASSPPASCRSTTSRVTVYREHDASERQPGGPPRGLRQKITGRAAHYPTCWPCRRTPKRATPQGCPGHIRNTSDANPLLRRHLSRPTHAGPAHAHPGTLIGTVPPPTKTPPACRPPPRIGIPSDAKASRHRDPERRLTRGRSASGWKEEEYEIDLNAEHAQQMRDALAAYVRAALAGQR